MSTTTNTVCDVIHKNHILEFNILTRCSCCNKRHRVKCNAVSQSILDELSYTCSFTSKRFSAIDVIEIRYSIFTEKLLVTEPHDAILDENVDNDCSRS